MPIFKVADPAPFRRVGVSLAMFTMFGVPEIWFGGINGRKRGRIVKTWLTNIVEDAIPISLDPKNCVLSAD